VVGVEVRQDDGVDVVDRAVALEFAQRAVAEVEDDAEAVVFDEGSRSRRCRGRRRSPNSRRS